MTTFPAYGFTQRTLEFIMFSLVAPLVLPSKIYVKTRYYDAKSKILYVLRFIMTIIHIIFIIGQCNNRMLLEKLVHTFIIGLRHVKIESYLCFETLNTGVYTYLHKDKFELSGKLELKL